MSNDFMVSSDELTRRAQVVAEAGAALHRIRAPETAPAGRSTDELAEAIRRVIALTDPLGDGLTTMASAFVVAAERYDAVDDAAADSLAGWIGS